MGLRLILDIPPADDSGGDCPAEISEQCKKNAEENYNAATDKLEEMYSA